MSVKKEEKKSFFGTMVLTAIPQKYDVVYLGDSAVFFKGILFLQFLPQLFSPRNIWKLYLWTIASSVALPSFP